jgi:Flp pilus assembly protein TadD
VSLIADALKAAQLEKSRSEPNQPRPARYLSLRQSDRKMSINKSAIVGTAALAGVLVIGVVVTALMAKSPSAPDVKEIPNNIVQPPTPEVTQAPAVDSIVTDSTAITPADAEDAANYVASAAPEEEPEPETTPEPDPPRVTSRPPGQLNITLDPPKSNAKPNSFNEAVAAQDRGDRVTAKRLYMQALIDNPNDPQIYSNLGNIHRINDDYTLAEEAYRNAIRINPRFGPAWNNLGILMEAMGRNQDAIDALQEAIKLEPGNAVTRANLATQYYRAKLYNDARRLLEEAIQINPGLAQAHYTLGQTLEAQGDIMGAIKSYNTFLSLAGNRFPAYQEQVRRRLSKLEGDISNVK